jgi:hypothetical protein
MAFDRRPMLVQVTDKLSVKNFIAERIGGEFVTGTYEVFDSSKIFFEKAIPREFVLKANHGSGMSIISWEGAPKGFIFPKNLNTIRTKKLLIHPDDLVLNKVRELCQLWLLQKYWIVGLSPEWAYSQIVPKVFTEELLIHNGNIPADFKFFMIQGECHMIQVDTERFFEHRRDLYSKEWEKLDATYGYPPSNILIEKPNHLALMLELAKALSKDFDFLRVDMYLTDQGVRIGELTNYPDGGREKIRPKRLNDSLSAAWSLDY